MHINNAVKLSGPVGLTSDKVTPAELGILKTLRPDNIGRLRLTRTMLEKFIIDANKSVRQLAQLFGVDYERLKAGEKIRIPAEYSGSGNAGSVTFYCTARGDRRVSLQGIKAEAVAGDLLGLGYERRESGELVLIVNVTEAAK